MTQLYTYTGGKPFNPANKRPTLVFLHGAQNDHSVWILQSRYLAHHGFNVLAFDLPGHGRSTGTANASVEEIANTIHSELVRRGVHSYVPIGHSLGSLVALELSQHVQVTGIGLVATSAPMPVSDALLELIKSDHEKALKQINLWSHNTISQRPGSPGPGFSIYIQNLRLMQRQPKDSLLTDFVACNAYQNGLLRAQSCTKPALIVQGTADAMTTYKAARALAGEFKTSPTFVPIESAGHALMAESPDRVLKALYSWLMNRW
jgi:pimeloyl-ACP methyl ester carboxylesterase